MDNNKFKSNPYNSLNTLISEHDLLNILKNHNIQDYKFAVNYGLNICSIFSSSKNHLSNKVPYCGYGVLINSDKFNIFIAFS